jgi:hypothetical protein
MMNLIEIVVSSRQHVPKENEGCHAGGGGDFASHVLPWWEWW